MQEHQEQEKPKKNNKFFLYALIIALAFVIGFFGFSKINQNKATKGNISDAQLTSSSDQKDNEVRAPKEVSNTLELFVSFYDSETGELRKNISDKELKKLEKSIKSIKDEDVKTDFNEKLEKIRKEIDSQ